MDNQPIDTSNFKGDTSSNNVDNNVIVVRRDEMPNIGNPDCSHSHKDGSTAFIEDSDEIGDMVAWVCTNCNRGVFLPKGKQII